MNSSTIDTLMSVCGCAILISCQPVAPKSVDSSAEASPRPLMTEVAAPIAGDGGVSDKTMPPIELGPVARVGDVELGKALPKHRLGEDLAGRYWTRLYADAQPIEGFEFDRPPVLALVAGGPYREFGYANPGAPVPKKVSDRAVELARESALTVSKIVITSPKLRTAGKGGVGVGSTYRDVVAAYASASPRRLPGLWEEPTCIVVIPSGAHRAGFFFKRCEQESQTGGASRIAIADDEPVIRVVLSLTPSAAD